MKLTLLRDFIIQEVLVLEGICLREISVVKGLASLNPLTPNIKEQLFLPQYVVPILFL